MIGPAKVAFLAFAVLLGGTSTMSHAGDTRLTWREREAERKRREEKERQKRIQEEKRRIAREKRLAEERVLREKTKEASKKLSEKEAEVQDARMARIAQELKAESSTNSDYVKPPKGAQQKKYTWTGKLSKESTTVAGKSHVMYVLTTKTGQRVIIGKPAMVSYSLTGMDLSLCVGKEITLIGLAHAYQKDGKILQYQVSKINSSTLKSSAIYDDLME